MFEKQKLQLNRYQADGILLLTAAIWGGGFAAQRIAVQFLGPMMINGIRFLLAAAFLLPFAHFRVEISKSNLPGVILAGAFLAIASNLQQLGLRYTSAGNGGFITGLYVILVPFFLWVFWQERVGWHTFLAAGIAVIGMLFINTGGALRFSSGDLYELAGAVFWALHVILIGIMVRKMNVLSFSIGQFAICGIVNLLSGFLFEPFQISNVWQAGWALLYAGIISGGIGYTLQAIGQRHSPASDAALILSMESVFAALFGYIFLQENTTSVQLIGYGLIFAAIVIAQILKPVPADQPRVSDSPHRIDQGLP
ncbi:DMT family transporter [Longilinea arvoryzae]|uniref:DMT family transporter n=1 Tax=Longilinea arvoryzae TaxID=360412 RepID=UPI001F2FC1CC|nr:DMT family transporter [Longilinea arvoryzae]